MIADHTHIKIKNNDILTVRGFCFDDIWAVPIYFYDKKGDRKFRNKRYLKYVDEFLEKYSKKRPEWIYYSSYGKRLRVPKNEINALYKPFCSEWEIYKHLQKDIYRKVVDVISGIVNRKDIGFIGSSMIGFDPQKNSDLDIVIRGLDNYKKIRRSFGSILLKLGATCSISKEQYNKSIKKYQKLFNKTNNDFREMIYNRWPTIHIPGELFFKVRFTLNPNKDKVINFPSKLKTEEIITSGRVLDDVGVSFMPRYFKIKSDNNIDYNIVTLFWDYSYCVNQGDLIRVIGAVDKDRKIIVIRDPKHHGIKFINQKKIQCPII